MNRLLYIFQKLVCRVFGHKFIPHIWEVTKDGLYLWDNCIRCKGTGYNLRSITANVLKTGERDEKY